jgi:hypothetical protein
MRGLGGLWRGREERQAPSQDDLTPSPGTSPLERKLTRARSAEAHRPRPTEGDHEADAAL